MDQPRTPDQHPPPLLPNNIISLPSLIDITEVKIHPFLRFSHFPSKLEYDIVKPPHTAYLQNQISDDDWKYLPAVEPPFSHVVSELTIRVSGVPSPVVIYPTEESSGIITIWDVFRRVYAAIRGVVEGKFGPDVDSVLRHPIIQKKYGPPPKNTPLPNDREAKEQRMYMIIRDFFGGGKLIWAGLHPSRTEPDVWVLYTRDNARKY